MPKVGNCNKIFPNHQCSWIPETKFRDSHRKGSVKNGALKKFRKFQRCLESLFNKVADLKAWNFIKNRLQHRFFPLKLAKFLVGYCSTLNQFWPVSARFLLIPARFLPIFLFQHLVYYCTNIFFLNIIFGII